MEKWPQKPTENLSLPLGRRVIGEPVQAPETIACINVFSKRNRCGLSFNPPNSTNCHIPGRPPCPGPVQDMKGPAPRAFPAPISSRFLSFSRCLISTHDVLVANMGPHGVASPFPWSRDPVDRRAHPRSGCLSESADSSDRGSRD